MDKAWNVCMALIVILSQPSEIIGLKIDRSMQTVSPWLDVEWHGSREENMSIWVDQQQRLPHHYYACEREQRQHAKIWTGSGRVPVQRIMDPGSCSSFQHPTRILFVGDSLSRLHAASVAGLLQASYNWDLPKFIQEKVPKGHYAGFPVSDHWVGCSGSLEVAWVRNDHVDVTTRSTEDSKNQRWAVPGFIQTWDVIVFNLGAHYVADPEFRNYVTKASHFLATYAKPQALRIYRTSVPGHNSCMNLTSAFGSLEIAEKYVETNPWYDGSHFKSQNAIAKAIVERFGFIYLNTYEPTILRGDMHCSNRDCLHYCLPGPSLIWADMLYTTMQSW
eukprot:CAMPEP_0168412748 /NCGR_PEP_ID=MMETSP0228-20121227/28869_1 /TAXON_ID=133427 /ORGANISM="Protoceratium reticulatum, Strain CCCM 535 (=CCMP 1889)" /LENGTH=332 /DNA_ID=CAMNT_0008426521 /DNA_START=95 /DNA_END=1090 /DNA_ORIENTATION=+